MTLVADIVEVDAPVSANTGDTIIVDVHVKNLGLAPGGYNYILVGGVYDSTSLNWQFPMEPPSQFSDYLYVAPQETVIFKGNFIMPPLGVTVKVDSWYWDGSKWVKDEEQSVNISLIGLEPTISEFKIVEFLKV